MSNIILQDTSTLAFRRRHQWQRHEVIAEGKTYGVTSVLPVRDVSFQNDTAADKLRYLVAGTKR